MQRSVNAPFALDAGSPAHPCVTARHGRRPCTPSRSSRWTRTGQIGAAVQSMVQVGSIVTGRAGVGGGSSHLSNQATGRRGSTSCGLGSLASALTRPPDDPDSQVRQVG